MHRPFIDITFFLRYPTPWEDRWRLEDGGEEDDEEADLAGDEPGEEEEDKGEVGEAGEGHVFEDFGELQNYRIINLH